MVTTTASPSAGGQNNQSTGHLSFKQEEKRFHPRPVETLDSSSSNSPGPIRMDGYEQDIVLSKSEFMTRQEVFNRRVRRVKQLSRIYRDHYWALMEELKLKYREYYWEYGKSPFIEDENDKINATGGESNNVNTGNLGVNGTKCGVHGCKAKAKAMALTKFCHMHILSDNKQKLYRACSFSIKSSTTGPILCGKPILRSTVPSYFQKAEKHMLRALKKNGLNISSTNKLAPKFHVIIAEFVLQIQQKRRGNLENAKVKEESIY